MKNGGTFIAKVFRGKDTYLLFKQLDCFFEDVFITKPRASRNSSIEAFIFCKSLKLIDNQDIDKILKEQVDLYFKTMLEEHANIQFRSAIGDLKDLDPDRNYSLEVSYNLEKEKSENDLKSIPIIVDLICSFSLDNCLIYSISPQ